jgi:protein arginine kinase
VDEGNGGISGWNLETPTEWLRGEGESSDVVMSSRVRLARNLAGMPFANKATRGQRQEVLDRCRVHIETCGIQPHIHWTDLHHAEPTIRSLLVERHLISQQHARGKQSSGSGGPDEPRGVAFTLPDERLSIMVNEEDHLRLQMIRCGLDLAKTLEEAVALDDRLEAGLDYAFSPRFGYLTACPTNVGTGVRMSVMLHLPALRLTGNIDKAKRAATDMSLAVRGFYGEGSEAAGDLYQISNQTTLGKPEETLLKELAEQIIPQVVAYERKARHDLLHKRRAELEDQVFRALGVLSNARLMTTEESMQLLSMVRLGCVAGLLPDLDAKVVNQLLLLTQPVHLQRAVGQELDQDQRRSARATLVRARLVRRG